MEPLPAFPLFPDPLREGVFEESKEVCGVCNKARGYIYTDQPGGPDEIADATICPWCIADGSAGRLGGVFNDATIYPVSEASARMTPEDEELVEQRTPGFVTWQGNHWLMCCGRACVYLGEADKTDLRGRWAGAVPSMFEGEDRPQREIDEIIDGVNRGGRATACAYVFQCQVCKGLRGYWDCD